MLALWPFTPNWEQPVNETLAWLTDVQRSSTGAELRRAALRPPPGAALRPRRPLAPSAPCSTCGHTPAPAAPWRCPSGPMCNCWMPTCCPAALPWPVARRGLTLWPAQAALLGESALDGELVMVDAVTPEGLILDGPVTSAWPAGTRLLPCARPLAELPGSHPQDRCAADRRGAQRGSHATGLPPCLRRSTAAHRYFAQRPDESQDLTRGFERLTELLDNDTGIPHLTDTAGRGFTLQQHRWALHGRTARRPCAACCVTCAASNAPAGCLPTPPTCCPCSAAPIT